MGQPQFLAGIVSLSGMVEVTVYVSPNTDPTLKAKIDELIRRNDFRTASDLRAKKVHISWTFDVVSKNAKSRVKVSTVTASEMEVARRIKGILMHADRESEPSLLPNA
jgi:hypothetical protein